MGRQKQMVPCRGLMAVRLDYLVNSKLAEVLFHKDKRDSY